MSKRKLLTIPKEVCRTIGKVCSKEASQFALNGVNVKHLENGNWELGASDGRIALRVRGESDPDTFPEVPGLEDGDAEQALIPANSLKDASKGCPNSSTKRIFETVAVAIKGEKYVQMAATDLETSQVTNVRQIVGSFPSLDEIIPRQEPVASVGLNPQLLVKLLQAMAPLTSLETGAVRIDFYSQNSAVKLSCSNGETEAVGVIMPVVLD